jgi:hypothetical protein
MVLRGCSCAGKMGRTSSRDEAQPVRQSWVVGEGVGNHGDVQFPITRDSICRAWASEWGSEDEVEGGKEMGKWRCGMECC